MLIVSLKLLWLAVLLVPLAAALVVVWGRWWRGGSASEVLLAALVSVPLVLLLEIVALNLAPVARPLDHLLMAHLLIAAASIGVVWRGRSELAAWARGARGGLASGLRDAGWAGGAVLVVGIAAQTAATGYGAWNGPWTVDEKAYHIPQAIQPYQDGRLGPVMVNVEWADSHPRGAALLYFWTLRLSGTDAGMHPVNGVLGFVLVLATYVGGRRAGVGRGWSMVAAGIVPVSPIMFYLSTVGNIDMAVSGLLGVAVAMALPRRGVGGEEGGWDWPSCAAMLIALLLALWMKLTPLPLALLLLGTRGLVALWAVGVRVRRGGVGAPAAALGPGPVGLAGAGVVMFAFASVPYLQTWERYGTPTYPFVLQIGPLRVFDGPMNIAAMMNRGTELSKIERFWLYWTPRTSEIGTEWPGTLGPVFAMVMVPAALACVLGLWWGRGGRGGLAWAVLGVSFWSVLVIPEHHVPRYAVWTLLPGAICVAKIGSSLRGEDGDEGGSDAALEQRRVARAWCLALLALQGAGLYAISRTFVPGVKWQIGTGLPLMTELRNRTVIDHVDRYGESTPTPQTRRRLYELMQPGETVVTAVDGLMALFWDPRLMYRVEHRPARRWPYPWPQPPEPGYGAEEAPAWLAGLRQDGVAAAMVYKGSDEDVALLSPGSGFALAYEQPPEDGPVIRIYRRAGE